jgi:hypothetical protein
VVPYKDRQFFEGEISKWMGDKKFVELLDRAGYKIGG